MKQIERHLIKKNEPTVNMTRSDSKVKLLLFISEDWYFWSHRLPIALSAQQRGWDVYLATRISNFKNPIEERNIHLIPLRHFKRSFQSPLKELKSFIELLRIYRTIRPDIVHHVAIKPIIAGTLAARLERVPCIVNAFAGMGFMFTNQSMIKSSFLRVLGVMLRLLFTASNIRVVFQNPHDLRQLISKKIIKRVQAALIKGSGVDTRQFKPGNEPSGLPIVVLPSRMLWDKGVGEFVKAARRINSKEQMARFVLVGSPDPENPSSISQSQLESWRNLGIVEWWGHQSDMAAVYAKAHIVCLPSYREGLPKVLLEAGAAGKPAVTTDTIGCRDIVQHGENGLLVEPRDALDLARKIETLINDPVRRKQMGIRARTKIKNGFTVENVTASTINLYGEMLAANAIEQNQQRG